ncbi:MAG: CHAD domain-containing protein [Gemmatimonadaceae bacterium]|nr:CHAD domain-containing protein [Gemmatimonadaceae bacterium]
MTAPVLPALDLLLDEDAQRAARLIAIDLQGRVRAARPRLDDPADVEALHDFRVAVRRLRSWLLCDAVLPGALAPRRGHKLLRRLAHATNASRDDEVFAEWLTGARATLATQHRGAADWMLARIGRLKREAERDLLAELDRDLEAAMVLLDEHLARYNVPHDVVRGAERETFAAAMSSLVRSSAARLQRRLAAVNGAEDHEAIHRARIAGKRLRYALEQVAAAVPGAQACLIRLKVLQDLLGDHHDDSVWLGLVHAAAPRAPRVIIRQGLRAIMARIEQRSADRYTALAEEWLSGGTTALFAALNEVADWLAARGTQGMEVERKYLLTGVPDALPPGRLQRLEQGYLPGKKLIERVRRAREGRAVKHYRTVKGGKGLARIEVEEQCTRSLFAALWPLTQGRRVIKRRHLIPNGERVWAIDVFTDRALVLAEVELPSTETEVTVPGWLAPYVVREVTEERGFVNAVLAR